METAKELLEAGDEWTDYIPPHPPPACLDREIHFDVGRVVATLSWLGAGPCQEGVLVHRARSQAFTRGETTMRYLIALLLPWLAFFTMGRIIQGILCLILQLTLIGWLPAALWAVISVSNYHAKQRRVLGL